MSLEQQIAALVQSSNNLTAEVTGKTAEIDQKVAAKETEVNNYLAAARDEYGHICTTANQIMTPNGTNTGVEGYSHVYMTLAVSVEAAFTVGAGSSNGWPNAAAQEFGEAVGCLYTSVPFNVLRVNWSGAGNVASRFNDKHADGAGQTSFTEAAYIKVISGTVGGDFVLRKQYANGWGLYGRYNNKPFNSSHTGMTLVSETGEMLIAMYARVTGYADLANGKWGLFPKLGA